MRYFKHQRFHWRRAMIKTESPMCSSECLQSCFAHFLACLCVYYFHVWFQRSDQFYMPNKNNMKSTLMFHLSYKMDIFMFTSLLCFFSAVCERINTVICLWVSHQGFTSSSWPPLVFSYQSLKQSGWQLFFLPAPLPKPFKHNECVETVLWLYMKRLWTVWGVQRNQTSLQRGGESSSVFAEWNLSTWLFDSPRSNSACQQWRI